MQIEEGKYKIEMTRDELVALDKGLTEFATLRSKYPDERNGYDLNSAGKVHFIHREIRIALDGA